MTTRTNRALKPHLLAALVVGFCALPHASWAACLAKSKQDNGITTAYALMLAPEAEVAQYEALGFVRVQCPTDLGVVRDYVERLCADPKRTDIRALDTEALIGRRRSIACASARAGLAEAGG